MNNILQKSDDESSKEDWTQQPDSASESKKLYSPLNFYFGVYSVLNYMGNYFWDLALFLF